MQDNAEWCNIIKISPKFHATNVALKADGTMTFGNIVNQYDNTLNDDWLEGISKWTNIIDFAYCTANYDYDCALVGIRSDGTLTAVTSDIFQPFENDLKKFNDVKAVIVKIENPTEKEFATGDCKKHLNIIALTNHDTIMTYTQGVFEELASPRIIDLANFYYVGNTIADIPFLYEDGTVRLKDSKIFMLEDVVYLDNNYAVTRNGSLYTYEATQYDDYLNEWKFEYIQNIQKTIVYDEWTERLK